MRLIAACVPPFCLAGCGHQQVRPLLNVVNPDTFFPEIPNPVFAHGSHCGFLATRYDTGVLAGSLDGDTVTWRQVSGLKHAVSMVTPVNAGTGLLGVVASDGFTRDAWDLTLACDGDSLLGVKTRRMRSLSSDLLTGASTNTGIALIQAEDSMTSVSWCHGKRGVCVDSVEITGLDKIDRLRQPLLAPLAAPEDTGRIVIAAGDIYVGRVGDLVDGGQVSKVERLSGSGGVCESFLARSVLLQSTEVAAVTRCVSGDGMNESTTITVFRANADRLLVGSPAWQGNGTDYRLHQVLAQGLQTMEVRSVITDDSIWLVGAAPGTPGQGTLSISCFPRMQASLGDGWAVDIGYTAPVALWGDKEDLVVADVAGAHRFACGG